MEITKTFYFDAAHRLHNVPKEHPCRSLHGHRYAVTAHLRTDKEVQDMVLDYHKLDSFKKYINDVFDHATLVARTDNMLWNLVCSDTENLVFDKVAYLVSITEITAENLAEHFTSTLRFDRNIPNGIEVCVTVQETPNTSATSNWRKVEHVKSRKRA